MSSYVEWVRKFCLSLPNTTEKVRWEHNLLFCVGEKMYCIANLEPSVSPTRISFKCTPEKFAELVEREGVIPAPYMARIFWVSLTELDALRRQEIEELIREAYQIVREKLPKKVLAQLDKKKPGAAGRSRKLPKKPAPR